MPRIDLIQIRGDSSADWLSLNPVLAEREMGIETDTRNFKFGDGVTAWADLSYSSSDTHNKGVYVSEAALILAEPTALPGDYAFVDTGAMSDAELYIWDDTDDEWVASGTGGVIPDASTTTKGKIELATNAEVQTGTATDLAVVPSALAAWWTNIKTLAQTFAAKITFTSAPRFSSATASQFLTVDTNKDLSSVPPAASSDLVAGSDNTKPVTALAYRGYRDLTRNTATISTGTMTLDFDFKQEVKFENLTTVSSGFTIAFSNEANIEVFVLILKITGTVAIVMPSSVVMSEDETRWNNGTKTLTLVGGTASPFELSFDTMEGPLYLLKAVTKYYAS